MPNTINKIAALCKFEDLISLLKSRTTLPPFEQESDPNMSAIHMLSEVFEATKPTQEDAATKKTTSKRKRNSK